MKIEKFFGKMSNAFREGFNRTDQDEGKVEMPGEEDSDKRARRALLARPSLSIRARLTIGFLLFFFLAAAATSLAWYTVHRLERRLHFLELADIYTFEIQQARRFEKNYFLYGTNLGDVLEHVETAQNLIVSAREEIRSVIGTDNLELMKQHLGSYKDLLMEMLELERNKSTGTAADRPQIEAELRRHGAEMISVAINFAGKERKAVDLTLQLFKRLPIFFLGALLLLAIYTANFLARQMLSPLNRLMNTTQRIGQGDFTPHLPGRRYKDEFTNLALAINSMMSELLRRQEILVESHKMKALGTLTAGVAHQLNNPLSNISTSCQILMEELAEEIPEYYRELLKSIEDQVLRGRDIVRALLEFSREREFELKPFDVREIVKDTVKLVRGELPHDVEIRMEIPEEVVVDLDKARIQQALLNLIMNGIQAMEEGGILTIRGSIDPGLRKATLEVADTGVGIHEEALTRVFDPFFTTKEEGKGTGLGLSLVYNIIEHHRGHISVQSDVGKGSKFIIDLPLKSVDRGTN
jgi:signal transduction histidine kinase